MRGNEGKGTPHWEQSREGFWEGSLRSRGRKRGPEVPGPSGDVPKAPDHQAQTDVSWGSDPETVGDAICFGRVTR
jgi:hypothetical protein